MQIEMPREPITGYTPFALGFRPFFLSAGLFAVLIFPIWLTLLWQGDVISSYYRDSISWHRHEMLFGFTMAVIAGFLLTAVKNWTNQNTPSGVPLALIFLLWLVGRVAPLTELPAQLIAAVDLLFAPLLAIVIAIPIWRSRQHNNQIFPFILLLIGIANFAIHLELLGFTTQAHFLISGGLQQLSEQFDISDNVKMAELSRQIKMLTLPNEMGELFKVICFSKQLKQNISGFDFINMKDKL